MHDVEDIRWEGCRWGVRADQAKVPFKFYFGIQRHKKYVEAVICVPSFGHVAENWQAGAIGRGRLAETPVSCRKVKRGSRSFRINGEYAAK